MAFLAVDRRSGFNRLQAAVYEGDYSTVLAACVYTENFLKEMSIVSTLNSAKNFPGKTACDILSGLDEEGHADIKKLYKEKAEKVATLTELHKCSEINDNETAVELVLHHGTDVNIPAKGNRTPLLLASPQSSSVYLKTLIDLGADTNSQRDDQCTPLIMASYWNNYMAVRLLTEAGVDAEIKSDTSNTALHVSAIRGFGHISKLLIESGCNVNLQNNSGKTPLCLAVQNGHKHLVKVLLENNADVNMCDKYEPEERLFLVRGKDKGRPAWHYVMVEKRLLGLFHKRANGGKLEVADFGTILGSGWGENPPDFKMADILKIQTIFRKTFKARQLFVSPVKLNMKTLTLLSSL
ncbi:hypothetical protein OS493_019523 [Desmophyllum pertusum]|uniref:Uncharacterized protein n=1 Tax=Desmophyllum pertusum TaxID=174260 RepID=A0A9W9ZNI5_9CNID|nr:hypothetical protein OS493_019523 [Desmophyllum pertusum]